MFPKCDYTPCKDSADSGANVSPGQGASSSSRANCVNVSQLMVSDFVDDAVAAVQYAASLPGVKTVVIAGHRPVTV